MSHVSVFPPTNQGAFLVSVSAWVFPATSLLNQSVKQLPFSCRARLSRILTDFFCCKYNNYLITLVQKQERFNIVLQIHSVILISLTLNQGKMKNIYIYNVSTFRGNFD